MSELNPYAPPRQQAFLPPYAHWGLRVAANLLDGLLVAPFYVAAVILMAVASRGVHTATTVDGYTTTTGNTNGALVALGILVYLAAIGFVIWNLWIRQGKTGYSLAKQWVGIRVVKDADPGQAPGVGLNIGRSFAHILDGLPCYLGYLWPLWDQKRQTFADKICSTVVITQKRDR